MKSSMFFNSSDNEDDGAGITKKVELPFGGMQCARAIRAKICKFNVNTEVRAAARAAVAARAAEGKDVLDVMVGAVDAMVPVIKSKLLAFAPQRT